ncbi:MAG TPA: Spo0B C-terminal domain-containing protein [Chondromyces sp.]|nr:Spo0B C-terminal domain-containing protein [Chondromyces sp.]
MKNDWTVVEALRFARHDWMNQIQLIKGFLALGKVERAEQFIEEIILQARQDSHLTNLELTELAELFLTFNWENHSFRLEYEIMQERLSVHAKGDWLTDWFKCLFTTLNDCVKPFADNLLYVSLEETAEGLRFFFDFSGIITKTEAITQWIEKSESPETMKRCRILTCSENELLFEMIL